MKTEQLYSVESVALSTDGLTADITIAGDASVSETTFLMPSTIYSCKIDADGAESTLEFQLPDVRSDMLVTAVNVEKNTITVSGSVRQGQNNNTYNRVLNVGDTYDGNLGALVGHTVVIGIDADSNITSLKVNDGDVKFGYLTAKDGNSDNAFNSDKDYFETASGEKYYLNTTRTSNANITYVIDADNSAGHVDATGWGIAPKRTYEYGKLILNPNGTVSAAVLWWAFDDHIIATETDGTVAKETSTNSKDFKGYTVIENGSFDYLDPTEISEGDIIYYYSDKKLAFVYNENVEGTLGAIYEDKLEIDGKKYNYIVWDADHELDPDWKIKQAEYYDSDNDTYELVTEKWAKKLVKTDPVTIYLDTKGDGVLVEGTIGESKTYKKQYIITQSPKAYVNGLAQMMDLTVSDGTETTLHIAAADIQTIGDDAFGDVTFSDTTGQYVFQIVDHDGKKTDANGKPNKDETGSDAPVDAQKTFQQGTLVEVTFDEDEATVIGLKAILSNTKNVKDITMKDTGDDAKSIEFKPGLASIKTSNGSLTLSDNTKVYVLTGTRLADKEYANATESDAGTGLFKEAHDNKVRVYDYADFDKNSQAASVKINVITTEEDPATTTKEEVVAANGPTVGSLIRFVADGTTAKAVVIDDRGWNNKLNGKVTPKIGTVGAADDIHGGQVFKEAETTTKVLGVATAAEYQLQSNNTDYQLAALTVLTSDGKVELDTFVAGLDDDQDIKGKIVLAELDATGKVTAITEGTNEIGNAAVDQVNVGNKKTFYSTLTDKIEVTTSGSDKLYNLKPDTDCLVVKFNGSSYSESSIGDINRDSDYESVMFWTSQKNGQDVKAKVIVATKSFVPGAYVQTLTDLLYDDDEIEAGTTMQLSAVDQYGELMTSGLTWASVTDTVANFKGAHGATNGSVVLEGLTVGTSSVSVTAGGVTKSHTFEVVAPATYTPVLTSMTFGTGTVDNANPFTVSITGAKDQYGVPMAVPALATTGALSDVDGTASTVKVTFTVTPGTTDGTGTLTVAPEGDLSVEIATYQTTYNTKVLKVTVTGGSATTTWITAS